MNLVERQMLNGLLFALRQQRLITRTHLRAVPADGKPTDPCPARLTGETATMDDPILADSTAATFRLCIHTRQAIPDTSLRRWAAGGAA